MEKDLMYLESFNEIISGNNFSYAWEKIIKNKA